MWLATKPVMILFSAAYFTISAFCSPYIFKYEEHFLSCFPAAANTFKLPSQIEEAGTSLHKGLFSSVLLQAGDSVLCLKYLNNALIRSSTCSYLYINKYSQIKFYGTLKNCKSLAQQIFPHL